jgi:chromosome segregation ATPase
MRTLHALAVSTLLLITLFASACDTGKAERQALIKQIEQLDKELAGLTAKRDDTQRAIQTLTVDIQRYDESLQLHSQRKTQLQDELAKFLLDHKMATAAVIAAGGGAATLINENIDQDTKDTLRLIGVIGAIYCLANSSECADVAAKGIYYGSQIAGENKELETATSARSSAASTLQDREQEQASLRSIIDMKQTQRTELKKKHDSLVCTLCI